MKHIIIPLSVMVFITLSSCGKKDYTCVCSGGFTGQGQTFTIDNSTKKDANSKCSSYNNAAVDGYNGCHIQ